MNSTVRTGIAALAMLALVSRSSAQVAPGPETHTLPDFDVRLDANERATPAVAQAIAQSHPVIGLDARAADRAALIQQIPGLRIDDHQILGTPWFVRSTQHLLTDPAAGADPRAVTRTFVAAHSALFEVSASELDVARMSRDYPTAHNGVRHLTFQQQIGGVDIFGCELRSNVTARGELINISSTLLPRPDGDFQLPAPTISPLDAIHAAAASIGVAITIDPQPLAQPSGVNLKQTWGPTPDFRADTAITTQLVYFPLTRSSIVPAWSLVLPEIGVGNTYEIIVDATNGQPLWRANELKFFGGTEPISMRVYTSDSPAPGSPGTSTPTGFQFPLVARNLVTINGIDVAAWSPNGWINDGVNETLGNNVDAHTDLDANNSPDLPRPAGVPYRVFDFALDTTMAPSTFRPAAVTQLFYLCNIYHDRLYALGFDEAAGNFQTDNFGMGGAGNDPVQADCQDGSGTNNANFGTPADGQSGRMQMYIFTGPTPDRDGDLDSDIVFHEHSHGLSNRLLGAGGLSGQQAGGMGEGWGDYFGISLAAESTDDPNAVYCTGGFTTYQLAAGFVNNYYFGIRRYPYSTDMTKSPLTYADIDQAQFAAPPGIPASPVVGGGGAGEVHNEGEIWCQTLLEGRANLWTTYGFAANELMMQLAVDGMKLSPAGPNFLIARDSILQADLVNNGGANLTALWTAFAKRGMGYSATSPASSATGVVEAFDVPSIIVFAYPNGRPTELQPTQPAVFDVVVTGVGATPTPNSGQLHYAVDNGSFTTVAMNETTPNHYTATLPGIPCLSTAHFYVSVGSSIGEKTDPSDAPTSTFDAFAAGTVNPVVDYNFESDPGWTVSTTASDGPWERAIPIPLSTCDRGNPGSDYDGSGFCWVTDNSPLNACNSDIDNGSTILTSQVIDLTGLADPYVQYARWYSNTAGADPQNDTFVVEVSSNGGTSWVNLETVGPNTSSPHPEVNGGWFVATYRIADVVPITSQFRIRFNASDLGSGSVVEAGIDAFKIFQYSCPPACLKGDLNADASVDGLDVALFASIAVNGGGTAAQICAGDVETTPDGAIGADDVANFVGCLLAGGCP